jgi:hypothetical protein
MGMEHDKILDELFCQIDEREEELLDCQKARVF